jgi:hypothetical protein
MAQAFSVVHIFIPGKATEHRLPQQPDQRMTAVLAGPRIGEHVPRHPAETDCIVECAMGKQSRIGGEGNLLRQPSEPWDGRRLPVAGLTPAPIFAGAANA